MKQAIIKNLTGQSTDTKKDSLNQYINTFINESKVTKAKGTLGTYVTYHKGNTSFTKSHPKHELMKTHTARRTFCTNAILAGMPPYQIMKITGHSSITNFEKYIKMSATIPLVYQDI